VTDDGGSVNAEERRAAHLGVVDPAAEAQYQNVVEGDRAARTWFIGAQAALVGAVTLFVLELKYAPKGPANIPFHGLIVEPGRLGVRLRAF